MNATLFREYADEDIARLGDTAFNALVQREARRLSPDYIATAWEWGGPVDAAPCACFQWQRYPAGQRHFGLTWWRTCSLDCRCACHHDEIWIAAPMSHEHDWQAEAR